MNRLTVIFKNLIGDSTVMSDNDVTLPEEKYGTKVFDWTTH